MDTHILVVLRSAQLRLRAWFRPMEEWASKQLPILRSACSKIAELATAAARQARHFANAGSTMVGEMLRELWRYMLSGLQELRELGKRLRSNRLDSVLMPGESPDEKAPSPRASRLLSGEDIAKAIESFERAINEAEGRARITWITLLSLMAYLFIYVTATTHKDILLNTGQKLPVLQIDMPLDAFYFFGPLLLVLVHFMAMTQVLFVKDTIGRYQQKVQELHLIQDEKLASWSRLSSGIFVRIPASPQRGELAFLQGLLEIVTLRLAPPLLLLCMQVVFLPYHSLAHTRWHRGLFLFDVALVFLVAGRGDYLVLSARSGASQLRRAAAGALWFGALIFSAPIVGFSLFAAQQREDYVWNVYGRCSEFMLGNDFNTLRADLKMLWRVRTALAPGEYDDSLLKYSTAPCPVAQFFQRSVPEFVNRANPPFSRDLLLLPEMQAYTDAEGTLKYRPFSLSLRQRDLQGAILVGVNFRNADLTGANLSEADLQGADLREVRLSCVDPDGRSGCASLQRARLDGAKLQKANLKRAHLEHATFWSADLSGADLTSAHMRGSGLRSAKMQGAELSGAELQGADLQRTKLQGANLSGAYLKGADLRWAEFQGANLRSIKLQGANLSFAQLQGADLRNSELQAADFYGTYLEGANFKSEGDGFNETDMEGAHLASAQLWRAFGDDRSHQGLDCRNILVRPWSKDEFVALKKLVTTIDDEDKRTEALKRIARLNPSQELPKDERDVPAFIEASRCSSYDPAKQDLALAQTLLKFACRSDPDSTYVAAALLHDAAGSFPAARFDGRPLQKEFLGGFLNSSQCKDARASVDRRIFDDAVKKVAN